MKLLQIEFYGILSPKVKAVNSHEEPQITDIPP